MTFYTAAKIGLGFGIAGLAARNLKVADPVSVLGLALVGQGLAWMPDFVVCCLKSFKRAPTPAPNDFLAFNISPTLSPQLPPSLSAMPRERVMPIQAPPDNLPPLRRTSSHHIDEETRFTAAVQQFESQEKYTVTWGEIRELRNLNPRFYHSKPFKLDLSKERMNDDELDYVVKHFPNIVEIDATQDVFRLNDDSLARIAKLNHLTILNLTAPSAVSSITDAGITHLTRLRKLKHLNLSGNHLITDDLLAALALSGLTITHLNLTYCPLITDKGIAFLADLPKLKSLNLSRNDQLTDDSLAPLEGCIKLKSLNLSGCGQITNNGMIHLSKTPNLEELNLRRCTRITDAGLPHLAQLANLARLHVSFFPNYPITFIGLASLDGLPKLTISTYNYD
jgi:Leucine Rich repeat